MFRESLPSEGSVLHKGVNATIGIFYKILDKLSWNLEQNILMLCHSAGLSSVEIGSVKVYNIQGVPGGM